MLTIVDDVLNKLAWLLGNFRSEFTVLSVLISFDSGYLGTFASRCWNDTVSLIDVVLTYVIYYIFVVITPARARFCEDCTTRSSVTHKSLVALLNTPPLDEMNASHSGTLMETQQVIQYSGSMKFESV